MKLNPNLLIRKYSISWKIIVNNQMITTKMFYNKKVICEVIDNGEEAIELVKNFKFDLSFNGCSFHQELMVR
jgi:hypothetical protein